MGDFSNKDQLISGRKALLEVIKVLGRSKADRFLRGLTTAAQIGSTDFTARGVDVFEVGLTQRRLDALLAKPKKKRTR